MNARLDAVRAFGESAPIAKWLNFTAESADRDVLYRLGFSQAHIGNPAIRALHGGVIAAFLELAMQADVASRCGRRAVRSVNIAVDYLASSRPEDMLARVKALRVGRRIAFLEAVGWQGDEGRPVAIARACLRLD